MLYSGDHGMFLVTETWLHSDISSAWLDPQSKYNVLRKDRATPIMVVVLLL